jgi:N6-adenosine-specific RNA methylase IME4
MKPVSLLVADPPWRFGDALPGKSRGASKNYATLSLAEIKNYKLPKLTDDALLLLWKVEAMSEEAYAVARAWGFVPKSSVVWVKGVSPKLHFGMGRYVRNAHETCIIAARGRAASKVTSHSIRSVFFAPIAFLAPTGQHSEKPDEFYNIAEALFPGPRYELFARKVRPGWGQSGLELGSIKNAG